LWSPLPVSFSVKMPPGAISDQLGGLMGQQGSGLLQTAIQNASRKSSGIIAAAVGIGTLVITASGVFTEMQQTLNVTRAQILTARLPKRTAA
jgi:uncharacterized BrkB/YihY/UPF0761 family membrane protein